MKAKPYLRISLITLFALLNLHCDGYLVIRGETRMFDRSDSSIVPNSKVEIFLSLKDSSLQSIRMKGTCVSDSSGRFHWDDIVPPTFSRHYGAVYSSKDDISSDTILFGYRSGDTITVKMILQKKGAP